MTKRGNRCRQALAQRHFEQHEDWLNTRLEGFHRVLSFRTSSLLTAFGNRKEQYRVPYFALQTIRTTARFKRQPETGSAFLSLYLNEKNDALKNSRLVSI